ncbi:unnamed protein product [marine sediment metagenome]|uniref:Uncharacterized protein n=1 Tax=marine sediment metagenome TaxID=412755 RepID=X0RK86_9ZZZZ
MSKKKHTHTAGEKKDPERSEKIHRLTAHLLLHMGVAAQYSIRVSFHDKVAPNNALPDGGDRFVTARCTDEYPYRVVSIEMNRGYVDSGSPFDLTKTIVHEILHVVPFADLSRYGSQLLGKDTSVDTWWMCLEEQAVDLLALWITRFWIDLEECEEKLAAAEKLARPTNSRSGKGSRRSKGRAAKG